jgi:FtsP/CotA-like multicopper oxidase with cupredoxin domain
MAVLDVHINDGFVPMVDGSLVYHRGFGDRRTAVNDPAPALAMTQRVITANGRVVVSRTYPLGAPVPPHGRPAPLRADPAFARQFLARRGYWASFFPPRTLIAETGSTIEIMVHNNLAQPHEMRFHGAGPGGADVGSGPVAPGQSKLVRFPAPRPGTYIYTDPGNQPVERTLGLYGGLVVIDPRNAWRLAPGAAEFERQWLWLCHDVDSNWARIASRGQRVDPVATPAVPNYFTINGFSGFQSLAVTTDLAFNDRRHEDTLPSGHPRETDVRNFSASPAAGAIRTGHLMRMLNAGIVDHQLHYHGNHVWTVRANGLDFPRSNGRVTPQGDVVLQQWEDTIQLQPLERKESMLPVRRPPDVVDPVWNARNEDWTYPMHCHAEPSQTARGGLYPGGLVADWVLAGQPAPSEGAPPTAADPHHTYRSQVDFASNQPHEGSPETEFPLKPDVFLEMDFFNRKFTFPDGSEHEMWSFEGNKFGRQIPGTTVRMQEGQLFQGTVKPSKRVHTIHWHGIEPDPRNDGVGHTSFEVTGHYTYQWRTDVGVPGNPHRGGAGTYFYHCHVNTPLHVQMGMFGPIVVDPPANPAAPVPAGTRRHSVDGPLYDIATETLIAPYSIDPRWHELNHAAGLNGEDAGLNRFEPKHFFLLGGNIPTRPRGDDVVWAVSQMRANVVRNGKYPTLVRMLNVDYFPTLTRITDAAGKPARIAELIAHDGRPFWNTPNPTGPAVQPSKAGQPLLTDIIKSGAAEKFDFLLRPPGPGKYTITISFLHWLTSEVLATRTVTVDAL